MCAYVMAPPFHLYLRVLYDSNTFCVVCLLDIHTVACVINV